MSSYDITNNTLVISNKNLYYYYNSMYKELLRYYDSASIISLFFLSCRLNKSIPSKI